MLFLIAFANANTTATPTKLPREGRKRKNQDSFTPPTSKNKDNTVTRNVDELKCFSGRLRSIKQTQAKAQCNT